MGQDKRGRDVFTSQASYEWRCSISARCVEGDPLLSHQSISFNGPTDTRRTVTTALDGRGAGKEAGLVAGKLRGCWSDGRRAADEQVEE